jgi:hypothetical protein
MRVRVACRYTGLQAVASPAAKASVDTTAALFRDLG